MNELQLKYGCNPNQKPSRIFMEDGSDLPIQVLSGRPGYINFLDAFNGWHLLHVHTRRPAVRVRPDHLPSIFLPVSHQAAIRLLLLPERHA